MLEAPGGDDRPIAPHRAASTALQPPQPPRPPPLARSRSAESVAALAHKWLAACRQGNYAIVQRGIQEGWAPVNAIDPTGGYTALMRCCVSGQMLDLLLGCRGIDVNLTGASDGSTPLLLAARYRSPRSVDALLRAGAQLSVCDVKGNTALHKAAANPNESTLQLLLSRGADPCVRDAHGRSPLACALLHANEAAALVLLRHQLACAVDGHWRASRLGEGSSSRDVDGSDGHQSGYAAAHANGSTGGSGEEGGGGRGGTGGGGDCSADGGGDSSADGGGDSSADSGGGDGGCGDGDGGGSGGDGGGGSGGDGGGGDSGGGDGGGGDSGGGDGDGGADSSGAKPGAAVTTAGWDTLPDDVLDKVVRSAGRGGVRLLRTCRRTRAAYRRCEAWHYVTPSASLNAPVVKYYPRGFRTTLLHLASAEGMEQLVPLLLQHGARHDVIDSDGLSPLEEARRCRRDSIMPLLMAAAPQSGDGAGSVGAVAEAAPASPDGDGGTT